MSRLVPLILSCGVAAFLTGCPGPSTGAAPQAPAPTGHADGHDHGAAGHAPAESPSAAPTSIADASAKLEAASKELEAIVKGGDLSKAHTVAERISKLAAPLAELATKAGLPPADVKELNIASKELQGLFEPMDGAGDAGNRAEAQKVFERYATPLGVVKKHAGHAH